MGLPIPEEDVRRVTEGIAEVAEAEQQAAMGEAERGEERVGAAEEEALVVVDGCMAHVHGAWHEARVAVCARADRGPRWTRN